jgi:hypothetical protein
MTRDGRDPTRPCQQHRTGPVLVRAVEFSAVEMRPHTVNILYRVFRFSAVTPPTVLLCLTHLIVYIQGAAVTPTGCAMGRSGGWCGVRRGVDVTMVNLEIKKETTVPVDCTVI